MKGELSIILSVLVVLMLTVGGLIFIEIRDRGAEPPPLGCRAPITYNDGCWAVEDIP